ncbi:MAG TPA: DUF948 domain-containing protein [Sporosarcina sp.]|nr:DUF948 domain-containing protein [Sporosarcina sp.]
MIPFISIATLLVTIGFALICIYIAKLLLQISRLLKTIGTTVSQVEGQLDGTIAETEQLMDSVEMTTTDVEEKLVALTPVFHSVNEVGIATTNFTETVHSYAEKLAEDQMIERTKPFIRIIQWNEFRTALQESWERGKKAANHS